MTLFKSLFILAFIVFLANCLTTEGPEYENEEGTGTGNEEEEQSVDEQANSDYAPEDITTVDIETKLGVIRGQQMNTVNGYPMNVFYSVPYAKNPPPRFEPPQKLDAFTEDNSPYEALRYMPSCLKWSADSMTMDPESSEDCLYLKIITPAEFENSLPVMFWLQGGGFNDGGVNMYDNHALGDNFVSKGVIIVQVQYRQGPLGFFTTGDEEAPGNYAIYDSLEALRFVRDNIEAFGGNPRMITIMGQESGAVMAELLTLSPMAYGLYTSVILMDGSAFDPAIFMNDEVNIKRSQKLAEKLGCDNPVDDYWNNGGKSEIVECLKYSVSPEDLISAISRYDIVAEDMPNQFSCNYYWRPRYDGYAGILPNSFDNLASGRPRVPALMGVMHRSWLMELIPDVIMTNTNQLPEDFNKTYNTPEFAEKACNMVIGDLDEIYASEEYVQNLIAKCVEKYVAEAMEGIDSPYWWLHKASKVGTGLHLMAPIKISAEHMRKQNNFKVFVYSFDYDRSSTKDPYWMAAGGYRTLEIALVENFFPAFNLTEKDFAVMDMFSNMLTNFAKYHDPTPAGTLKDGGKRWRNYLSGYFSIDEPDMTEMKKDFNTEDTDFWIDNEALNEYHNSKSYDEEYRLY